MESTASAQQTLGHILSKANAARSAVAVPSALIPEDSGQAYAVQQFILGDTNARVGGWKVGSKSPDGPMQGAPLPQQGVYQSGAVIDTRNYPVLGIELEIFFCLSRDFMPGQADVGEADVMQSIATMGASIEIVSSRIEGWPQVPPLLMLADLQSHGGLIVGAAIDYRSAFPFQQPVAHLTIDGKNIFQGNGANPAGDPRRLLHWVVNHCGRQGIPLLAGTPITTGSFTGMHFPAGAGHVRGEIAGLPAIDFALA